MIVRPERSGEQAAVRCVVQRAFAHHSVVRRPSLRIPVPALMVCELPAYEPWMTGTLVYGEPFWRLDCVGLRD